jgi:hypothetical protein
MLEIVLEMNDPYVKKTAPRGKANFITEMQEVGECSFLLSHFGYLRWH